MFQKVIDTLTAAQASRAVKDLEHYPILSAQELLASRNRIRLLKEIRALVDVSEDHYRQLYLPLIHKTAEFAQCLPETVDSYFSYVGGLFDFCLETTASALGVRRNYEAPIRELPTLLSEQEALWDYAVFSSALLHGIGKIASEKIVTICDREENVVRFWLPYQGPMTGVAGQRGTIYRYSFIEDYWYSISHLSSLVLSIDHLIPPNALHWMSSHKPIFNYWLAVMTGDYQNAGTLGDIVTKVKQRITEKELETATYDLEGLLPSSFYEKMGLAVKEGYPGKEKKTETDPAKAFLKWLRKEIKRGNIKVNGKNASVHIVREGVLLLPKAFQEFKSQNASFNIKDVQKGLGDKGVLAKTTTGETQITYTNEKQGETVRGVVAESTAVYLKSQAPYPSHEYKLTGSVLRSIQPPPVPIKAVQAKLDFSRDFSRGR